MSWSSLAFKENRLLNIYGTCFLVRRQKGREIHSFLHRIACCWSGAKYPFIQQLKQMFLLLWELWKHSHREGNQQWVQRREPSQVFQVQQQDRSASHPQTLERPGNFPKSVLPFITPQHCTAGTVKSPALAGLSRQNPGALEQTGEFIISLHCIKLWKD